MNKIKYIILLFILLLLIIPTIVAVDDSIKADSTIIVNASNITVGDIEKITVHVNEDATGVINITVEGKTYSAPIDKGIATFKIDNLASGSYDVSASYDGDENYLFLLKLMKKPRQTLQLLLMQTILLWETAKR
mgnify:CR=1 FL=1